METYDRYPYIWWAVIVGTIYVSAYGIYNMPHIEDYFWHLMHKGVLIKG
jgi:hypothetical protein